MQSDDRVFFKLEGMPDLLNIKKLIFADLPIENLKGINLPKNLPNVELMQFYNCPLESLEGLPSEMQNLKSLSIGRLPNLKDLKGFPKIVPELDGLAINNLPELRSLEGLPSDLPKFGHLALRNLPKLHSFKGLPQNLPYFSHIKIQDVNLHTFKHLPEKVSPHHFSFRIINYKNLPKSPVLLDLPIKAPFSGFYIQDCIIKDLSFFSHYSVDDLKKADFGFERCIFHSFEGFPTIPEEIDLKEIFDRLDYEEKTYEPCFSIGRGCKIRSFSGLSLPFLHYIFPHLIFQDFFDFAPLGRKLLEKIVNWKYLKRTRRKNAKKGFRLGFDPEIYESNMYHIAHRYISNPASISPHERERLIHEAAINDDIKKVLENDLSPRNPIFQQISQYIALETLNWLHLEFLPELYEYFKVPILELAYNYISDPTNMPPDQIERLAHEADHNIRKILENALPLKNPVLLQISQNLSFNMANGLKILK